MRESLRQKTLDRRVRAVWRRGQMLHVAAGVLAFCGWAVLLFLVAVAVDWMTNLPESGRVLIFVAMMGMSLYMAWRRGLRHTRFFDAAHTALRIEKHLGGLESLLVTAVQLGQAGPISGTSQSLCEQTCRRAEQSAETLRPAEIVRYDRLRRPLASVLILGLILGGFALLGGPFLKVAVARILPPWSSIDYPTRTQVDLVSGDMIVQEGRPARIEARISGVVPSRAKLALRTGPRAGRDVKGDGLGGRSYGTPRIRTLDVVDGVCEYTVETAFRGFEYRILAGDAKSPWNSVDVISCPRIERAEVSLEFPAYTDRPIETVEALTVTVPEGTRIHWQLTLDRAVSRADYSPAEGQSQPLEVSSDGRCVTIEQVATESRAYRFSWVEREHGFAFTGPSHYIQVAPDHSPHVEITSPKSNLYATLGRKLDLAFRGRDDHGIGESVVVYRVGKTEEQVVPFSAPALRDGGEQTIEWDYRSELTDLAVGDTVSFAVELTDRYPGPDGPHRVRSMARRISFLSREDYLAHIAKQERRLLSQLRAIYRQQRKVHQIVRQLDPSDDLFVQTCQLEAVRQELIRQRIGGLKVRMCELLEDLAANGITEETETATLVRVSSDLETIADEHVGRAASSLRKLAAASNGTGSSRAVDPQFAVQMVDGAARELACLVLQIGFKEATEVMARELHAVAETQARLRLQTLMSAEAVSDETEGLADAQQRLAGWLVRLFDAIPRDKESTVEDALVAFNLSRLIKQLRGVGVDTDMLEAATMIRDAKAGGAVGLQADVIKALLRAEFRLRVGAEYEALFTAGELFTSQADEQRKLRESITSLSIEAFKKRRAEFAQAQAALHRKLQLLLMPAVPPPRPRLFDTDLPQRPPVDELLAKAEGAMEEAARHIATGDRDNAAAEQQQASAAFEALAEIVHRRIEDMTERDRIAGVLGTYGKHATEVGQFEERQLGLLEKTEDAADDGGDAAFLARLQQKLIEDVEKFRKGIVKQSKGAATPNEAALPLLGCLDKTRDSMADAVSSLNDDRPGEAIARQEAALDALAEAFGRIEQQTTSLSAFKAAMDDAWIARTPGPYVADIRAEQSDLVVATKEAKQSELPHLAIVQKNLVHAVNAVLYSLEALSHRIESGTTMLFAKEDMDAAATAIEENDLVEAEDAQTFVAESLGDLLAELQNVTPQYNYILELSEFFHEIVTEGMVLRATQSRLIEDTQAAPDGAALRGIVDRQRALKVRARAYGSQLLKATGLQKYNAAAECMSVAISQLEAGDREAALEQMTLALDAFSADTEQLLHLNELLSNVLKPPPGPEPTQEALVALDLLAVASQQKVLYRQTQTAAPKQTAELAAKQHELGERCGSLAKSTESFAKAHMAEAESRLRAEYQRNGMSNGDGPPLAEVIANQQEQLQDFFADSHDAMIAANKLMSEAASKLEGESKDEALTDQREAGELLRHVFLGYVDEFLVVPGPPAAADPAITDPIESLSDDMMIFMPGAVSGEKPRGGRLEWEVLGRRDRAALNENFARELPLEYRAILKDYYERLSQ